MRYKFLIILLFFGILIMFLCLSEFIPVSTPVIRGQDGKILENSVTMLEKIEIGGMEQWILIRGNDISNPVLLWLHGGPGASQMSVSQYFNGDLEKDFIVVHWDQRGAGKSNPSNFNEKTMTIEQYVSDTHELTIYLKNKFGKEKIYLLGHSWGALLGIETVKNYPEDYYAYIGVSQPVSNDIISQSISYEWLSQQMLAKGNQKELKKLKDLGEIPYIDHDNYVKFANMVSSYGGVWT
ncbi:MAG: short chain dehydrogenase [Candidatus Methanofastidiosum methylothiophilum]|uniref:prolyl aminopeptidase n=1 Tax=Candidatus Methanofastidiosum methylothiophilum TaxID=1705564 RepID=A0A150IK99_9EURY|nr:MAG: short chain dehydrogenase [Candidatus Methanofastidiosum methylthiophilus]KYC47208.1 MAG: short chain dehydrogenase [Candidatus Methanofastidiosum methylthiophilus]KYC51449.1 MAG: short chain dehydrogenase [Candidatus Methanofastidiosum methylthiophilus]